jgi:hypothetical protein
VNVKVKVKVKVNDNDNAEHAIQPMSSAPQEKHEDH